jgi:SAM-dependent methyltransferase
MSSEWEGIAGEAEDEELRERILTGYKEGKPFTPYVPTVALPAALDWVLDFGCGVGRNFPYLKSIATHVAGFDLPPMIERCRALATERVDLLTADWNEISSRQFDLVFADLVLQHLETSVCREYLAAFAQAAPVTYVLTRLQSDFGANVPALIKESELFEVEACVEVEHYAVLHQLRQVGQRSIAEISQATNDKHYELLLRRR